MEEHRRKDVIEEGRDELGRRIFKVFVGDAVIELRCSENLSTCSIMNGEPNELHLMALAKVWGIEGRISMIPPEAAHVVMDEAGSRSSDDVNELKDDENAESSNYIENLVMIAVREIVDEVGQEICYALAEAVRESGLLGDFAEELLFDAIKRKLKKVVGIECPF